MQGQECQKGEPIVLGHPRTPAVGLLGAQHRDAAAPVVVQDTLERHRRPGEIADEPVQQGSVARPSLNGRIQRKGVLHVAEWDMVVANCIGESARLDAAIEPGGA